MLATIRSIVKPQGKWTKWQKSHKVAVTSAWQAIELYQAAGSEAAVAGLTRTEALIKFNITNSKPKPVAKGATTMKYDRKVAPKKYPRSWDGNNQDAQQPTTEHAPVDQQEQPEAIETPVPQSVPPVDAPVAQPVASEPTIQSTTALEYLHKINLKLEELERGLVGVKPDDHFLGLCDRAIATLQRLRGDVPADIDAA